MVLKNIIITVAVLSVTVTANAQSSKNKIVAAAVPFLRINADVRSAGMGDGGIATDADTYSGFRNLSKTVFASKSAGVAASYTPWMGEVSDGIYLAGVTGYHKLDEEQAITAGIRYFNLGTAYLADAAGNKLGSSNPREFAAELGYSRKLSPVLSAGVGLRYIHSRLVSGNYNGMDFRSGTAVAGDISLYYRKRNIAGEGLTAGLVLSNLGSKISYQNNADAKNLLPANIGIGVGYTFAFEGGNKLAFNLEGNKLLVPSLPQTEQEILAYHDMGLIESWGKSFSSANGGFRTGQLGFGVEYSYNDFFFLRAGYAKDGRYRTLGESRGYTTLGIGLAYSQFHVDFSYLAAPNVGVAGNPSANTMRFGVRYDFGK